MAQPESEGTTMATAATAFPGARPQEYLGLAARMRWALRAATLAAALAGLTLALGSAAGVYVRAGNWWRRRWM
jgi:hypothetical protein